MVGDSLSVGVEPYIAGSLSAKGCSLAWIDAKVSRRTSEGLPIIQARAADGSLPHVLIVGLGTNDRYELAGFAGRVDAVIAAASGRQIIWINTSHLPVRDHVNAVLADRAARHANFSVMDWNTPYWSNPALRARDNIHGTPAGYQERSNMMANNAQIVTK